MFIEESYDLRKVFKENWLRRDFKLDDEANMKDACIKELQVRLDVVLLHSFDFLGIEQVHEFMKNLRINSLSVLPDYCLQDRDILTSPVPFGKPQTSIFQVLEDNVVVFSYNSYEERDVTFLMRTPMIPLHEPVIEGTEEIEISPGGGMVDTVVSKTPFLLVQVLFRVYILRQLTQWLSASFTPKWLLVRIPHCLNL